MINNLAIFIFSIIFSLFALKNLSPLLKKYLMYKPNFRTSHKIPTPSGGGISFILITIIGSFYLLFTNGFSLEYILPILCLPLAIVGFIDDLFDIRVIYRFLIQFFSTILVIYFSPMNFGFLDIPLFAFLILLIMSIVNFFNFMDGADGLLGSSMLVLFSTIMISTKSFQPLLFVLGGLFGFLLLNWQPAKVFMGDVGSTFLGLYFSGLLLQTHSLENFISLLLIAMPLLGDSFFCLIRRLLAKQNPFKAHKLHLYQRLIKGGWSHKKVSLLYFSASLISSITYLNFGIKLLIILVIFEFILGFWLDHKYASPFGIEKNL